MGVRITDINGNVIEDSSNDSNHPRYDRSQPEKQDRGGLRDEYRKPSQPPAGGDLDLNIQPVPTNDRQKRRDENPTPWAPFLH